MKIDSFIKINGLKQADAIIVQKQQLALLDHYVIFLGYRPDTNEPVFIANYKEGVRIIPKSELIYYLNKYKPVAIRRFKGTNMERSFAVNRAFSDLKNRKDVAYNLIKNNCEHFANWVQQGVRRSDQVKNYGQATALSGLALTTAGIAKKNDKLMLGGLMVALIGAIVTSFEEE